MSGHIDTREGWRELDVVTPDSIYQLAEYDPADGSVVRAWVREAPVPPLPTEPYTVIRAEGDAFEAVMVLQPSGTWTTTSGNRIELRPADHRITGFEVLAEPRAATAKALLAELEDYFDGAWTPGHERLFSYDHQRALFARLRTPFGASS